MNTQHAHAYHTVRWQQRERARGTAGGREGARHSTPVSVRNSSGAQFRWLAGTAWYRISGKWLRLSNHAGIAILRKWPSAREPYPEVRLQTSGVFHLRYGNARRSAPVAHHGRPHDAHAHTHITPRDVIRRVCMLRVSASAQQARCGAKERASRQLLRHALGAPPAALAGECMARLPSKSAPPTHPRVLFTAQICPRARGARGGARKSRDAIPESQRRAEPLSLLAARAGCEPPGGAPRAPGERECRPRGLEPHGGAAGRELRARRAACGQHASRQPLLPRRAARLAPRRRGRGVRRACRGARRAAGGRARLGHRCGARAPRAGAFWRHFSAIPLRRLRQARAAQ